jgi:hypothetical protein
MNKWKRFSLALLALVILLGGLSFNPGSAYAMPFAVKTYTVQVSQVSFVSGMLNSDKNWARANVPCTGSTNFKLSTNLYTWPFNPANWSSQWCQNNVVQIGIPSAFYLWVWPITAPYKNPANWKITYTR